MKLAGILLLAAAGIYAMGDAVLAPAPTPEHPGFVDAVLASRSALAAIRLSVIFAGAFVVVSVVALISQRRWLTRVGPVQVSETKTEDRRIWEEVVDTSDALVRLRQQIAGIDEALNEYPREPKDPNEREANSKTQGTKSQSPQVG
jgi:hypothetical protein